MTDCVFCKIVDKELPSEVVYEDELVVAFLALHPINESHTLVVPKQHFVDITDTPDLFLSAMISACKKVAKGMLRGQVEGVNIGMNNKESAGQEVFHAHMHVIPRESGDGLKHWPGKLASVEQLKDVAVDLRERITREDPKPRPDPVTY